MAATALPVWLLLLPMMLGDQPTALAACVDPGTARWNNIDETTTDPKIIKTAPTATGVVLSGQDTSDTLNISKYFEASLSGGDILLTPKPALAGVSDYPVNNRTIGDGVCRVTCPSSSGEFTVTVTVKDANTAQPTMSSDSYTVDVLENYPTDLAIAGLVINASDYDKDANNHELTFSLDGSSTFSLSPATLASAWPPTYTTRLVLTRSLDWSNTSEYRLTVTATDPGGLRATSDVTVTVVDVDNQPPVFGRSGYTAEALDPKAVGPLAVSPEGISATDPDIGGPLTYSLIDLPGASWAQYFALDPDSAKLSLAKAIPAEIATPSEISLVVEVRETGGAGFTSRSVLVVYLTPQPGEESSDVGYIVGLAVLGCLTLVLAGLAAVWYRRASRGAAASQKAIDSESDSVPGKRVDSTDRPAPVSPPRHSTPPPPTSGRHAFDNPGYTSDQSVSAAQYSLESERHQNAAPSSTTLQTATERHLYPSLTSESHDSSQPISDEHVPSAPPIDDDAGPAPPIGARPDDVSEASPPMGDEDSAPPEEPRPDYAAKSVGFKDTVVCVTPVEAADVVQVDADDDDDEEDDAEVAGDDAVQSGEEGNLRKGSTAGAGEEDSAL